MFERLIREMRNFKLIEFENHEYDTHSVQWSPNARYVAFCGSEGTVLIWDRTTETISNFETDRGQDNLTLAWSPMQPILAVLMGNGKFYFLSFNRNYFKPISLETAFSTRLTNHYSSSSIAWSPFGEKIAVGVNRNRILIVNHEGIEPYCTDIRFTRLQLEIKPTVWLPTNNIIATFDKELILYSNTGMRKKLLLATEYQVENMKFSNTYKQIAVAYDYQGIQEEIDRKIDIITLSGQIIDSIPLQLDQAYALAFSPNKKYIAVAGESDHIFIHSMTAALEEDFSIEIEGPVYSIDWSPDGKFLAIARIRAPPLLIDFLYDYERFRQ